MHIKSLHLTNMTIRFVEKMLFFDTFLECVLNQKIELNTRNIRFRLCWDL